MFKLSFLPARFGDAIWIEYGSPVEPHYLLIDGGTAGTRHQISEKLGAAGSMPANLDLLVVSHIDHDHIQGVLVCSSRIRLPCAPRRSGSTAFTTSNSWTTRFSIVPARQNGLRLPGPAGMGLEHILW